MRELSIAIVGADHPNLKGPGRRFELTMCNIGEPVELRPEPKNVADEHAIAVYSARGIQIGYVTSQRAPFIGKLMKEYEVRAIFQGHAAFGGWARIAFDEDPVLPPAITPQQEGPRRQATAPDDHTGFWPDPVYDEPA